jgi:hypothetical protein
MLNRLAEKMNERLVPLYGDNMFLAFDNVIPEDKEFLLKKQTEQLKTGYTVINEERQKDGQDPVEWGDRPLLPMNIVPLGTSPAQGEQTITEEEAKEFTGKVIDNIRKKLGG